MTAALIGERRLARFYSGSVTAKCSFSVYPAGYLGTFRLVRLLGDGSARRCAANLRVESVALRFYQKTVRTSAGVRDMGRHPEEVAMPREGKRMSIALAILCLLNLNSQGFGQDKIAAPKSSPTAANHKSSESKLTETLIELEKKSWEAWKNRDGEFFRHFLSDDHVEIGVGGPTDKTTVVRFVGSPVCVVKSYSVDRFQLTLFAGNMALLTYHAMQDTTCGGRPVPSPVWVASLYIKRGDRWLNAAYQQTQTRD